MLADEGCDVALLARGTYYRKLGELNRGTGYAASVPDGALSYMDSALETGVRVAFLADTHVACLNRGKA